MITKELFVNTMDTIQKEWEKTNRFDTALREICDGYPIVMLGSGYLNALLSILNAYFDDKNDLVSWWLFEKVEKKIWETDAITGEKVEYDVSTPEALYNYLSKNVKDK